MPSDQTTMERPRLERAAKHLSGEMPTALARADHRGGKIVVSFPRGAPLALPKNWMGWPVEAAHAKR